jgi:hypothetical protein
MIPWNHGARSTTVSVDRRLQRDYKIPLPEGDTGEFAKVIAPIFHEAGLSQGQVQKIAEKHNAFIAEQTKAATEKRPRPHTPQK